MLVGVGNRAAIATNQKVGRQLHRWWRSALVIAVFDESIGYSLLDAEQRRWLLNEHYHHALRTPPSSSSTTPSASASASASISAAMGNGIGLGQVRLINPSFIPHTR